ncbi:MAG TPA: glycosyltransferase [Thiobacillaceae bacterium]|nr:glycosyltransferase [Thiobacillaceae bacterium]
MSLKCVNLTPKVILFLVRSLDRGGAERQLVVLAKGLVRRGHTVAVAVFFGGGVFETELTRTGIRVIHLDKKGRWDILPFLSRLALLLRKERPAVLHSYLAVPNILASALKSLVPGTRIAWGVRASNMDLSRYDWLARLAYSLERRLAHFADVIIANSHSGKRYAVANGFPEDKIAIVSNGIDTEYFRFDPAGRRQVRSAWKFGEDEILVGLVGRLDPMKDHPTFLEAASRIARERRSVRFICVGDGPGAYSEMLKQQARGLGLTSQLIWAGARDDMPAVYSALDIVSSTSSYGEGFTNTVAEAMACGVPCVVTDVGDSALIVGDTGRVVAPGDPSTLAAAIQHLTDLPPDERRALGETCRARVVAEFGIDKLVQRSEQALGLH